MPPSGVSNLEKSEVPKDLPKRPKTPTVPKLAVDLDNNRIVVGKFKFQPIIIYTLMSCPEGKTYMLQNI